MCNDDDAPPFVSPKKLRSCQHKAGGTPIHCVICEGENTDDLHKAVTDNVDSNSKSWAETSKNFKFLGRLLTQASTVHTADVCYHTKCHVRLRDTARQQSQDTSRVSEGEASSNEWGTMFDHLTIAQIVALAEHSNSPFTVSYLRQLHGEFGPY